VKFFLLTASLAVSVALACPVAAQMQTREGIALQNQILELRRDLQDLQAQIASGAGAAPPPAITAAPNRAPNDIVVALLDRVSQLEEQVRQLRGRIDETANQVQRQNEDLGKQIADLGFRVQTLEGGGRGPGPVTPGPANLQPSNLGGQPQPFSGTLALPPNDAAPPRTPELVLQAGNAALARRDYASAEAAAREVLAGRSPRAYDAQFLLAQALMGKRDFQQAAIAFDDAYNRGRTGPHAQDALLGLANSLGAINERRAACETLVKLRTEFPQPRPDVRDGVIALRQRAGCV